MTLFTRICTLGVLSLLFAVFGPAGHTPAQAAGTAEAPLRTLIVGGGPDFSHNQVAIESNVRYVARLLPSKAPTHILFADGSRKTRDVLYLDKNGKDRYRAPNLPAINGPNRLPAFDAQMAALTQSGPLLLYFTGHGSPGRRSYDNNEYDMWADDTLNVTHLAGTLKKLPPAIPVTVIMVQCFSGSFGNLLFENGDPNGPLIDRPLCGFFASISARPAAGCTPEVDEANYHDFTSYFFAALSGTNRLGQPVSGADYDHSGKVGMNEAFAYTLLHDNSIDTPVCTSDVFLRRFVKTADADVFQTPYAQVRAWAAPAQLAALEGLSDQLQLTGDDRLARAYARFQKIDVDSERPQDVRLLRFVRLAKSITLAHTLQASPATALKQRFAALLAAESGSPL